MRSCDHNDASKLLSDDIPQKYINCELEMPNTTNATQFPQCHTQKLDNNTHFQAQALSKMLQIISLNIIICLFQN